MKNHGVNYPMQSEEILTKRKVTYNKNYGCDHHFQSSSFFKTKLYKHKEYTFPSGNKIFVQGNEPKAIDILLRLRYSENDIITDRSQTPEFWYNTTDGKKHRYYPDIYIPIKNLIIEVKSSYTATCSIEINQLKRNSVIASGIRFETWIL